MASMRETIQANLQKVQERIAAACARRGRSPAEVTLVAVTKYARLEWVRELAELGHVTQGENRPQQLMERAGELPSTLHWHLIGPLQRNKVRAVLPSVAMIHSVDSLRLAESIDRIAGELDLRPRVLLELNLSGEETKHGFGRDELFLLWDQLAALERLRIEGLMTMAAPTADAEQARPTFALLHETLERLRGMAGRHDALQQLSMGMSGDFEVAVEEGATLVRIGSALWEGLEEDSSHR